MAIEDTRNATDNMIQEADKGLQRLDRASKTHIDLLGLLGIYLKAVDALPDAELLNEKRETALMHQGQAEGHIWTVVRGIEDLESDNHRLVKADKALKGAVGQLKNPSDIGGGLQEIQDLRNALHSKVTEVIGTVTANLMQHGDSPLSKASEGVYLSIEEIAAYREQL